MAKKGIFKKILKGAAIIGGSVLGLTIGGGLLKGAVKGTGALIGAKDSLQKLKGRTTGLKDSAARLLTGKTKTERALLNKVKDEGREAQRKLKVMADLVNAGMPEAEARAQLGIPEEELTTFEGEPIVKKNLLGSLGSNPMMLLLIGGVVLMFILKKKR